MQGRHLASSGQYVGRLGNPRGTCLIPSQSRAGSTRSWLQQSLYGCNWVYKQGLPASGQSAVTKAAQSTQSDGHGHGDSDSDSRGPGPRARRAREPETERSEARSPGQPNVNARAAAAAAPSH